MSLPWVITFGVFGFLPNSLLGFTIIGENSSAKCSGVFRPSIDEAV